LFQPVIINHVIPVVVQIFPPAHFLVTPVISYRKNQQDATMYQILLFHIYMKLNMFRATHCPSSGAKNCTGSL